MGGEWTISELTVPGLGPAGLSGRVLHRDDGPIVAWPTYVEMVDGVPPTPSLVSNYPLAGAGAGAGAASYILTDVDLIQGLEPLPSGGALLVSESDNCLAGFEFSPDTKEWVTVLDFCPEGESVHARVATNSSGTAVIAWSSRIHIGNDDWRGQAQRIVRDPQSGTWGAPETIFDGGTRPSGLISLALGPTGQMAAAFVTREDGTEENYCRPETHYYVMGISDPLSGSRTTIQSDRCEERVRIGVGDEAGWIEEGPLVDGLGSGNLWYRTGPDEPQLFRTLEGNLRSLEAVYDPDGGGVFWWEERDIGRWVALPPWE
jgi:hypothetical protein